LLNGRRSGLVGRLLRRGLRLNRRLLKLRRSGLESRRRSGLLRKRRAAAERNRADKYAYSGTDNRYLHIIIIQ
jgi:hypothetical protein